MSYTFMVKPVNIKEALIKVETSILSAGGTFKNNKFELATKIGKFSGSYTVGEEVSITIEKKPMIVSMSTVENYIRNFFKT